MVKVRGLRQTAIPVTDIRRKRVRNLAKKATALGDDTLRQSDDEDLFALAKRSNDRGRATKIGAFLGGYFAKDSVKVIEGWGPGLGQPQYLIKAAPGYSSSAILSRAGLMGGSIAAGLDALRSGLRNREAVKEGRKTAKEGVVDTAKDTSIGFGAGFAGAAIGAAAGNVQWLSKVGGFRCALVSAIVGMTIYHIAHRVVDHSQYV